MEDCTYTVFTNSLEIRTKLPDEDPERLLHHKPIGFLLEQTKVKCLATTRINNSIWMYIGLDSNRDEQWCCADNGEYSNVG